MAEPMTTSIYVENDSHTVLTEHEMEEKFDEVLNEQYPEGIDIIGLTYDAARLLKDSDPVAYRETYLNYVDSLTRDGEWHEMEMPFEIWVTFDQNRYEEWILEELDK